jgi:hypothetical protein
MALPGQADYMRMALDEMADMTTDHSPPSATIDALM